MPLALPLSPTCPSRSPAWTTWPRAALGPVVQMGVVVTFTPGPDHPDLAATEAALADVRDDAGSDAAHRGAALGEDVDAGVGAVTATWCAEGVGDLAWPHAVHWHRQLRGRRHPRECPQHLRCGGPGLFHNAIIATTAMASHRPRSNQRRRRWAWEGDVFMVSDCSAEPCSAAVTLRSKRSRAWLSATEPGPAAL